MKCSNCGKDIPDGSLFCNYCGGKQEQQPVTESTVDEVVLDITSEKKSKKSFGKMKWAVGIIAIILLVVAFNGATRFSNYRKSISSLEKGQFEDAFEYFEKIGKYNVKRVEGFYLALTDASIREKNLSPYNSAQQNMPYTAFYLLTDSIKEQCGMKIKYAQANLLEESGEYIEAHYAFIRLGDYEDSVERAESAITNHPEPFYQKAIEDYEGNDVLGLELAKSEFETLGDYKDSKEYVDNIDFIKSYEGTYYKEAGTYTSSERLVFDGRDVTIHTDDGRSDDQYMKLSISEYEGEKILLGKRKENSTSGWVFKKTSAGVNYLYVNISSDGSLYKEFYDGHFIICRKQSNSTAQLKDPEIGMSAEQVRNSTWGEPKEINKTTYAWGTSEQWVYSGYRYIYLDDGIVTAIQE